MTSIESTPPRHILTILAVAELARSVAFYREAFGWPTRIEVPVFVEFELPDGRGLGLYQREAFAHNTGELPEPVAEGRIGGTELYLHVDDLTAAVGRLEAAGGRCLSPPALRPWGDLAAYYADPDGVVLVVAHPAETDDAQASTGVVVVDHGSRRPAANEALERLVGRLREQGPYRLVEPAHMELAEPTIAQAFDRCVAGGARQIVVLPYFLSPGKHWEEDIPRLAREAAAAHPGLRYLVSAPVGLQSGMRELLHARLERCLAHAAGEATECEACRGTGRCRMQEG